MGPSSSLSDKGVTMMARRDLLALEGEGISGEGSQEGEVPPWKPEEPIGNCAAAADQKTRKLKCLWARECGEEDDSVIPYFTTYYCAGYHGGASMATFLITVAIFYAVVLFVLLGNTADEALGPPLAQFSDELHLPPRFAGVTLLALGNGAPDISATVAAVRGGDWRLSLGALTGAGMFVTTCVAGMVTFVGGGARMVGAQVRDTCALLVSVVVVGLALANGEVTRLIASVWIMIYGGFVLIVLMSDIWHRKVTLPHRELQEMARKLAEAQLARTSAGFGDAENGLMMTRMHSTSMERPLIDGGEGGGGGGGGAAGRAVDWTTKLFGKPKEDRYIVRHLEASARREIQQQLNSAAFKSQAAARIRRKSMAISIDDADMISSMRRRDIRDASDDDEDASALLTDGRAADGDMGHVGRGNEESSRGRAESLDRSRRRPRSLSEPGRVEDLANEGSSAQDVLAAPAQRPALTRSKTRVMRRYSTFSPGMVGDSGDGNGEATASLEPAASSPRGVAISKRLAAVQDQATRTGYTPPSPRLLLGESGRDDHNGGSAMRFNPLGADERSDDEGDDVPLLPMRSTSGSITDRTDDEGDDDEDDGPPLPMLGRVLFRARKKLEWLRDGDVSPMEKVMTILDLPHKCVRRITVPITAKDEYCRPYLVASCVGVVPWLAWNAGYDGIIYQIVAVAIGSGFGWVISRCTVDLVPPTWGFGTSFPLGSALLALVGFIAAAAWVNLLAGELVALLGLLGAIFGIDSDIMGLTVLAWGNSVGDLSANIAMAKRGLGNMAMTACFAGPIFNMMVGLGIGFTLRLMDLKAGRVPGVPPCASPCSTDVVLSPSIAVGLAFMAFNCVAAIFIGNFVFGGDLPKNFGLASLMLYGVYLLVEVVLKFILK
ncbi:sodium/potassium/calcium exchanger [Pseudoscourfieldia marina]